MGLRNGTTRNTGLQENRLEQLLFGAKAQVVASTKPLLKLSLLKPDLHAVLELGVGVFCVCGVLVLFQQEMLQVPSQCLNLEPVLEAPCWCFSMSLVS